MLWLLWQWLGGILSINGDERHIVVLAIPFGDDGGLFTLPQENPPAVSSNSAFEVLIGREG